MFQSAWRESNPRPASYKDAALTAVPHATASRAGGNRTHTLRIKSPLCCQLHHDPMDRSGVSVSIATQTTSCFSFRFALSRVVALRVELSATRLSAGFGQPALDYRHTSLQVGKVGFEPTISCSQNTRASRCPTSRLSVRTAGFEPAISWPPTRRDNQASPRSVFTACSRCSVSQMQ